MNATANQALQAEVDEPVLTPQLDPRWALKLTHVLIVVAWATSFLILNYMPLRDSSIWAQVVRGNWIIQQRSLPSEDPFLGLSEGMPVVYDNWLTQVILAGTASAGDEWLSNIFALAVLATFLLLAAGTFYLQSRHAGVALLGVLGVALISWSRFTSLRPETIAMLCFSGLLWLIVSSSAGGGSKLRLWLGVPVLFAVWANLDSSFILGLAVLACYFVGNAIEVGWRSRSASAVLADSSVRRWLYVVELGVAGSLLNPYGIDLLLHTTWFADHRNLKEILDWQQVALLRGGGREFALSIVAMIVILRHSRHRVPVAHGLLLAVFAVAVVFQRRMIGWYAPVFGLMMTPHLMDLSSQLRRKTVKAVEVPDGQLPPGRSWRYSLVCLLVVWIAFTFSGLGTSLLGGESRTPEQIYGKQAPLGLTQYLRDNQPNGQVFHPHLWGDWLALRGPSTFQPFVTTQIQFTPRQVWHDYGGVSRANATWGGILQRYRVNTLIVDKKLQETLSRQVRVDSEWKVRYEDDQSVVFVRQKTRTTELGDPPAANQLAPAMLKKDLVNEQS